MTVANLEQGTTTVSFESLVRRARSLAASEHRRILGITGAPGAGKTTLAEAITKELADQAVFVPMDGFHFANSILYASGSRNRKGAPDTFDAGGFVALLKRLQSQIEDVVYAPRFDRAMDESIGSAIAIPRKAPLIVTEGNYLLLKSHGWEAVRALLDESWFIAPPEDLRHQRLIERHEQFGLDPEQAKAWALGTDEYNARLVAGTRAAADLVACVTGIPHRQQVVPHHE